MLATQVFSNIDYFVVGRYLGAAALAHYTLAFQLAIIPCSGSREILSRVAFPSLARIQSDLPRIRRAFTQMVRVPATLVTAGAVLLAVAAPTLIARLYGPSWLPRRGRCSFSRWRRHSTSSTARRRCSARWDARRWTSDSRPCACDIRPGRGDGADVRDGGRGREHPGGGCAHRDREAVRGEMDGGWPCPDPAWSGSSARGSAVVMPAATRARPLAEGAETGVGVRRAGRRALARQEARSEVAGALWPAILLAAAWTVAQILAGCGVLPDDLRAALVFWKNAFGILFFLAAAVRALGVQTQPPRPRCRRVSRLRCLPVVGANGFDDR